MTDEEEKRLFATIDNIEQHVVHQSQVLDKIMKQTTPDYFGEFVRSYVADVFGDLTLGE